MEIYLGIRKNDVSHLWTSIHQVWSLWNLSRRDEKHVPFERVHHLNQCSPGPPGSISIEDVESWFVQLQACVSSRILPEEYINNKSETKSVTHPFKWPVYTGRQRHFLFDTERIHSIKIKESKVCKPFANWRELWGRRWWLVGQIDVLSKHICYTTDSDFSVVILDYFECRSGSIRIWHFRIIGIHHRP